MANDSLQIRELFVVCIKTCDRDAQVLQTLFNESSGNQQDKKSILEQAFRDCLHDIITTDTGYQPVTTQLVDLSISSAQLGICYYTVPFILLGDIFDCYTLDTCEKVFGYVESRVSTWTSKEFYSSGKILLLRMCNDLLRRLSSAQNTVFCGRIQLFLAQLFPLSEKSALNLMSHFNVENITSYNKEAGVKQNKDSEDVDESEAMDVDEKLSELKAGPPIDYNLYHKLWSIQDAFRQPTQSFSSDFWKTFTENIREILQAFSSFKLEDTSHSSAFSQKRGKKQRTKSTSDYSESHYFAKFLTSEKLMNLQLQDSHFRRHILIQLLVLFQYLTTNTKFKSSAQVLSEAGSQWIKDTSADVYQLIAETPPRGKEFAAYIRKMLEQEESRIAWKNDGCPSFEKPPLLDKDLSPFPQREHLGDIISSPTIDMGNAELTRLWNLCPDNLEACKQKSRNFVPDLKEFLEEPIEQADPAAQIEDEYKLINNPNFMWRALRVLSQGSPSFFQNTTASIKQIPEFIEHVMIQTGKDFQTGNST